MDEQARGPQGRAEAGWCWGTRENQHEEGLLSFCIFFLFRIFLSEQQQQQ